MKAGLTQFIKADGERDGRVWRLAQQAVPAPTGAGEIRICGGRELAWKASLAQSTA
jgi:hypothetical protein